MISESLVSHDNLEDFSYSHSMSRLKSISMIRKYLKDLDYCIDLQFVKRAKFPVARSIYMQEGSVFYLEGPIQEERHESIIS